MGWYMVSLIDVIEISDNGYLPGGTHEGMTTCYNPQDDAKELFYCPYRG